MFSKIKNFVQRTIDCLRRHLSKDFNFKKTLISCLISFVAFSLIFPAGALSSKTINEACADYFAEIAQTHINDNGIKKLTGLIVEPKDPKTSKMRQDTENAITELWGVFKGNNASFAPVINANRNYEIKFVDEQFSSESLPLVYSNVGGSAEPYHIDKKTGETIDYKFQSSPLALMFPSNASGMRKELHIFISQAQAERKLSVLGKEINKKNLQDLLTKPTQMSINGNFYECIIDNIYLDNFDHSFKLTDNEYYYGTDIGSIIGDFVFVTLYANMPWVFPDETEVKRQSLYVMSEFSYRNKFYLEYAKEAYSPESFSFDYVRTNFKDGFVPNDKLLQNSLQSLKTNGWSVTISIVLIIIFICSLVFIFRYKLLKQPLSLLMISVSSFVPYLLFKLLFRITGNVFLFSLYSTNMTLILLVVFAVFILVINCFGRQLDMEAKSV